MVPKAAKGTDGTRARPPSKKNLPRDPGEQDSAPETALENAQANGHRQTPDTAPVSTLPDEPREPGNAWRGTYVSTAQQLRQRKDK